LPILTNIQLNGCHRKHTSHHTDRTTDVPGGNGKSNEGSLQGHHAANETTNQSAE